MIQIVKSKFDPKKIIGLKAWYDFTLLPNNNSNNSEIADTVPNLAGEISYSLLSYGPFLRYNQHNGLAALDFSISDTYLYMYELNSISLSDYSIFIVQKTTGNCKLLSYDSNNHLGVGYSDTDYIYTDVQTTITSSEVVSRDIVSLVQVHRTGSNVFFFRNNIPIERLTGGNSTSLSLSKIGGDNSEPVNGIIFEVIIYNKYLTGIERESVESYINRKYHLWDY